MTKAFNQICTEEGVQCVVTLNPMNWATLYEFKNVGKKLVRVMYDEIDVLLEPQEEVKISIPAHSQARPYVATVNNGVDDDR